MVLYLVIDQFFSSKKAQKACFLSNDFVWLSLCFVLVRIGYWRAHLHMGLSGLLAPSETVRCSLAPTGAFQGDVGVGQSHLGGALHTRHCALGQNHPPPWGGVHAGRLCWGPRSNGPHGLAAGPDSGYSRLQATCSVSAALPVAREQPQAKGWLWPCATETLQALTFEFQIFLIYCKIVLLIFSFFCHLKMFGPADSLKQSL